MKKRSQMGVASLGATLLVTAVSVGAAMAATNFVTEDFGDCVATYGHFDSASTHYAITDNINGTNCGSMNVIARYYVGGGVYVRTDYVFSSFIARVEAYGTVQWSSHRVNEPGTGFLSRTLW